MKTQQEVNRNCPNYSNKYLLDISTNLGYPSMKSQSRFVNDLKEQFKLFVNPDSALIYSVFIKFFVFGLMFIRVQRQFRWI